MNIDQDKPVSFVKRLASMFYDSFLLIAIILVAVTVITIPSNLLLGDEGLTDLLKQTHWKLLFQLYLAGVSMLFFAGFWIRGGQTLGMKVWKIRLGNELGENVSAGQALKRIGWAIITNLPFGAGLLWSLFDRERLSLYDRLSKTRLYNVRHD